MKINFKYLKKFCTQVRRDILRMINHAGSGHPGGSLSSTEYIVSLYKVIMHYSNKFDMTGYMEDIFFLSNGHISPLYYSVLARCGFFPLYELNTFRQINSRLQGHPTPYENLPGIRIASGSLGQGMSVAIGAAHSKKLNKDPYIVYSLHGDGELNEGQIWEAVLYAGAKKIDNYIAAIDYNKQQIDGPIDQVLSLGDLKKKFEAFEWTVIEENQGNILENVISSIIKAKNQLNQGKPIVIILHTNMGYGVDFMKNDYHWHGKAINNLELKEALKQLPETIGDYTL